MEDFGDYIYIVLKMLYYNEKEDEIQAEQVSLILGSNFVISFQEREGDVFNPIRERIRSDILPTHKGWGIRRQFSVTGTPQGGVISPLLANIYLDQIDKGWKPLNKFAHLIRYADDVLILTRYGTKKVFYQFQQLTVTLKLKLNLKKTRIVDAEKGSFDFLGYSFRKALNRRKTRMVVYFWPTQEAEKTIREKVRKITNLTRPIKVEKVIEQLNPVIRGWVNYFRIANSSRKFSKIRLYAAKKVRKFMRRRRNKSGYGYKDYPDGYLYKRLGLYRDYRLSWMKALR